MDFGELVVTENQHSDEKNRCVASPWFPSSCDNDDHLDAFIDSFFTYHPTWNRNLHDDVSVMHMDHRRELIVVIPPHTHAPSFLPILLMFSKVWNVLCNA